MIVRRRLWAMALVAAGIAGLGAGTASAAWFGLPDLAVNPPGQAIDGPSVAMARDGTAFAALAHFDGAHSRVGVAMHVPGGGFGPVRDLSAAGTDAGDPVVAVDRQGNATLAYLDASGVETRFRPAGGDWGALNGPLSVPSASDLSLAVGDNGAAAVVWWARLSATALQTQAAVRAPRAASFGGMLPLSINDGSTRCPGTHVAMDAAGDAAAIWTRRTTGGNYIVETATKAAGAASFAPANGEARSATNGFSPCNTAIEMTPGGRVTALWDASGPGADLVANVAYADRSAPFASGAWSSAAKLSVPADASGRPAFSLDDAGNAAATWIDRGTGQILSSVRTGLGGFSPPKPLSGSTDTGDHAVGAGPNGDAIAVWVAASNGNDAVFSARRTGAAELGDVTPIVASAPTGGRVFYRSPDVALDDQGNAFAVWQRVDSGDVSDVFTAQVAAFDPMPPTLDAVDVPGAGTATQAVGMSAGASDRMSAPAIHFDFGDGSGADGGSVQHVYATAGSYTVTVTATDAAGNDSSASRAIAIGPAPVVAGTGPTGPTGPIGPQRLLAVSSLSWDRLSNGDTRLRKLVIEGLTGEETIKLACTGRHKGCRKAATRTIKQPGRKLSLTKYVKGMVLKPRAVLSITAGRTGFVTRTVSYTMIKHKDPRKTTRCLVPGAKKTTSC